MSGDLRIFAHVSGRRYGGKSHMAAMITAAHIKTGKRAALITKDDAGKFTAARSSASPDSMTGARSRTSVMASNWIGDYEDLESTDPVVMAPTIATRWGGIDGDHHKAWVIDQMVRALTGERYEVFVTEAKDGPDGPDSWDWNEGIYP